MNLREVKANWPAASCIEALVTTRQIGHSLPPYQANNLALHVGDEAAHVHANRLALLQAFNLPAEPVWLEQTHSTTCVRVEQEPNRLADAAVTSCPGVPLAVMTADCLPIVLCNKKGDEIAAIHAGWRGLVHGIVENTLEKMNASPQTLMAWIGPAICLQCFEVGQDVVDAYVNRYPSFAQQAFKRHGERWLADLPQLAEWVLRAQGVNAVYQSNLCTFEQTSHFYSYRRQEKTGRMATLIWIK